MDGAGLGGVVDESLAVVVALQRAASALVAGEQNEDAPAFLAVGRLVAGQPDAGHGSTELSRSITKIRRYEFGRTSAYIQQKLGK